MPEMKNDLNLIEEQIEMGRSGLEAQRNPDKYMPQTNNPLAQTLLAFGKGYQAGGQGSAPLAGGLGMIGSALSGAAAGAQFQQDNLALEQVSPRLAEAFPELVGTNAKVAYDLIGKLQSYFAQKNKAAPQFDESDFPIITQILESKGYKPEEIPALLPAFVGQPKNVIKDIAPKTRLPKRLLNMKVTRDKWGIATHLQGYDELSGAFSKVDFKENLSAGEELATVQKANNAINILYDRFNALDTEDKKTLNKAAAEYANTELGDEAGFIQRLNGVINTALSKQAIGGERGQKLKALIDAINANIPRIARGLGHTGVLTELDVIKSFGIAPDPKGTEIENKERKAIYNDILKGNIESILNSTSDILDKDGNTVPAYDRENILKLLRIKDDNNKPVISSVSASPIRQTTPAIDFDAFNAELKKAGYDIGGR